MSAFCFHRFHDLLGLSRSSVGARSLLAASAVLLCGLAIESAAGDVHTVLNEVRIQSPATRFRRPTHFCWIDPGQLLAVANRRGESVSVIDVLQRQVVGEFCVNAQVLDVASLKQRVAGQTHRFLLVLKKTGIYLTTTNSKRMLDHQHVSLGGKPAELAVANSGGEVAVSSVWRRCVWLFDVEHPEGHGVRNATSNIPPILVRNKKVDLNFEPRLIEFSLMDRF